MRQNSECFFARRRAAVGARGKGRANPRAGEVAEQCTAVVARELHAALAGGLAGRHAGNWR